MRFARANRRNGFTLVEVLLATVLAAVLLVALWSLLSMYSKAFESGQARTEQAQLARTLLEQVATDLQGVLHAPPRGGPSPLSVAGGFSSGSPPPSASSGPSQTTQSAAPTVSSTLPAQTAGTSTGVIATTSLRPAGLFGTDTLLQIDVLQPVMVEPTTEFDQAASFDSDEPMSPKAEELKTVIYSFEPLSDLDQPLGEHLMHLVRREMDWADAHPAARAIGSRTSGPDSALVARPSELVAETAETTTGPVEDEPATTDQGVTSVPEVIRFAMRYFDGTTWSNEWDSTVRGGLPLAVEVAVQLRSFDEPDPLSTEAVVPEGLDEQQLLKWTHPQYRLLIPLAIAERKSDASNSPFGTPSPGAEVSLGSSLP